MGPLVLETLAPIVGDEMGTLYDTFLGTEVAEGAAVEEEGEEVEAGEALLATGEERSCIESWSKKLTAGGRES